MTSSPQILIITEGKDDKIFFNSFCDFLNLTNIKITSINEERGRGGKSSLFNIDDLHGAMIADDNDKINKIVIICDADLAEIKGKYDGLENTKRELDNLKKDIKKVPKLANKKIKYFILPNNKDDGIIEDLFLNSMDKNLANKFDCANEFIKCSKENIAKNKISKIKAGLLLRVSSHNEKDDIRSVGFAAKQDNKKQYWNFESKALEPLRNFLKNL